MAKVYQFAVWDHAAGEMKTQLLKSTEERIKRIGGEIIDGTGEDVPENMLDSEGRYDPTRREGGGFGIGGYGDGAYGETGYGGAPSSARGTLQPEAFQSNAFEEASEPNRITDPALSPNGRVTFQGSRAGAESSAFALNAVPFEVTTPNDPSGTVIESRRRQQAAFVADLTSGPTAPIGPAGTTLIAGRQPTAGTAPSFLSSGVTDNSTSPKLTLATEAVIRERPADIEAMARELGHQFEQQAERLRGKNSRSKEEDELFDFLRLMATRLNELADAIKDAMARPAEEPIFLGKAAKIATELETGFLEFVTKHRVHVWEVGAIGVALCFFSQLGLSPKEAADFLRQIIWPKLT
jgi:hypothetical protein